MGVHSPLVAAESTWMVISVCLANVEVVRLTKTLEAAVTAAPSEGAPATVVAMAARTTPTSVVSFMMET